MIRGSPMHDPTGTMLFALCLFPHSHRLYVYEKKLLKKNLCNRPNFHSKLFRSCSRTEEPTYWIAAATILMLSAVMIGKGVGSSTVSIYSVWLLKATAAAKSRNWRGKMGRHCLNTYLNSRQNMSKSPQLPLAGRERFRNKYLIR